MNGSSLRPLNGDFESAGVIQALLRLYEGMSHMIDVPDLPLWIVENRLDHISESGSYSGKIKEEADEIVPLLRKIEIEVMVKTLGGVPEDHTTACSSNSSNTLHSILLARLLLGACCEAYASYKCNLICNPGDHPKKKKDAKEASRLYKDSCLAAVWTSVHAQHAHDILIGSSELAAPCLHSVPSEFCEFDLSDLYAHRTCIRSLKSKDSVNILTLMTRCTNPGSRGWESVVSSALDRSDGTRRICAYAAIISLSGMNSAIHPVTRPRWKQRMHIMSVVSPILNSSSMSGIMRSCLMEFKECVRRMTYNCISSAYAMVEALAHLVHPVSLLKHGATQLPTPGLEASATAFVKAAKAIVEPPLQRDVLSCIKWAFEDQTLLKSTNETLKWNPSYLGALPSLPNSAPLTPLSTHPPTQSTKWQAREPLPSTKRFLRCL